MEVAVIDLIFLGRPLRGRGQRLQREHQEQSQPQKTTHGDPSTARIKTETSFLRHMTRRARGTRVRADHFRASVFTTVPFSGRPTDRGEKMFKPSCSAI